MELFDLAGKIAIVTGGTGGIGLGIARGLAAAGAKLALVGRNQEKGERARKLLDGAAFIAADVTRKADCAAMVKATVDRFGRLDILVNNAGMSIRKQPEDYEEAEWHAVIDGNLTSAFLCCQAAYPQMKKAGAGKIINIGSMMSIFASPYVAPYAASKGGVVQLTRTLATAWASDRIQVNAILPGWVDTELTQAARRHDPPLNERVVSRTPAGRWGAPEDFSGIAVFLAASASDFITGAAIPVDGGFSIRG